MSRGPDLLSIIVPVYIFGALLVAATFVLGRRFGPRVGFASAILAACSPVFLYQLVQPRSDVPAAALWVAAVAAATGAGRHAALAAGLATSGAILMRPNLVPLAVPLALFLLLRPERDWRQRIRAAATYAGWSIPGGVAVALYGSPFSSGYGPSDSLFAAASVLPNASRYATWLSETHTPIWILSAAAVWLLPGALTRLLVSLFLVNVALHLPYTVVDDSSYLGFLLPTIPVVLILVAASVDAVCRRLAGPQSRTRPRYVGRVLFSRPGWASLVLAVITGTLAVLFVAEARARGIFNLHEPEATSRFLLFERWEERIFRR